MLRPGEEDKFQGFHFVESQHACRLSSLNIFVASRLRPRTALPRARGYRRVTADTRDRGDLLEQPQEQASRGQRARRRQVESLNDIQVALPIEIAAFRRVFLRARVLIHADIADSRTQQRAPRQETRSRALTVSDGALLAAVPAQSTLDSVGARSRCRCSGPDGVRVRQSGRRGVVTDETTAISTNAA